MAMIDKTLIAFSLCCHKPSLIISETD